MDVVWSLQRGGSDATLTAVIPEGLRIKALAPHGSLTISPAPLDPPEPLRFFDPMTGYPESVYTGKVQFRIPDPGDAPVSVTWQACTDDVCYAPTTLELT